MTTIRGNTSAGLYTELERELKEITGRGLLRNLQLIESPIGSRVRIGGSEILLFCTNDYLGLANHPSVKRAAKEAIDKYGAGAGASRLVAGTLPVHAELEAALARFKGTESAIVFGSGYLANVGTISAIMQRGDAVYSDELNHASIVDACRLCRAEVNIYPHADTAALERMLEDGTTYNKRLIVTDGVFSMDGDIAPLPELARLASEFNCSLMVDDAHATGVLGPGGRGTSSHFTLEDRVEIQMGTMSKALGSYGAFVAGSHQLVDFLVNRARSFIFTTALPPPAAAAALESLRIIDGEPERRERLWDNASLLRDGLISIGFDIGSSETFIIPVIIGDARECVRLGEALLEEGIFAQAIRPPSVPEGSSRLRVVPTAEHKETDIEIALAAFERAGRKCGVI